MKRVRTDTATIKHQVTSLAIAKAGENGGRTDEEDSEEKVEDLWGTLCEDGVVGGGGPEVLVGDGRLPEGERVSNPVCEEGACKEGGLAQLIKRESDAPRRKEVTQTTMPVRAPMMKREEEGGGHTNNPRSFFGNSLFSLHSHAHNTCSSFARVCAHTHNDSLVCRSALRTTQSFCRRSLGVACRSWSASFGSVSSERQKVIWGLLPLAGFLPSGPLIRRVP